MTKIVIGGLPQTLQSVLVRAGEKKVVEDLLEDFDSSPAPDASMNETWTGLLLLQNSAKFLSAGVLLRINSEETVRAIDTGLKSTDQDVRSTTTEALIGYINDTYEPKKARLEWFDKVIDAVATWPAGTRRVQARHKIEATVEGGLERPSEAADWEARTAKMKRLGIPVLRF